MKSERYEKWGATLRRELSRSGDSTTRLDEHGLALTTRSFFESRSLPPGDSTTNLSMLLPQIAALDEKEVRPLIERFTLTHGSALHHFRSEDHDASWTTVHQRLHISMVHEEHRVELNLDCEDEPQTSSMIRYTAAALKRARPSSQKRVADLSLAPQAAARFWRALLFSPAAGVLSEHGLKILQRPRHDGEVDGNGTTVEVIDAIENPPPNVYRPSYRTAAVGLPLNVSVECKTEGVEDAAVSLLAITRGPELTLGGFVEATALCSDSQDGSCFIAQVRVSPADFCARISSISDNRIWFPEVAGIFGSETRLREIELLPT